MAICSAAPPGKAPSFLVAALKDPIGANLDRIQIVKGWLGRDGSTQERSMMWRSPAAARSARMAGPRPGRQYGRCRERDLDQHDRRRRDDPVWKDPEFDPALRAFYYVRVIEIPTPRWTAYDAKYFGIRMPPEVPMTTTERAYTSPIWYTP